MKLFRFLLSGFLLLLISLTNFAQTDTLHHKKPAVPPTADAPKPATTIEIINAGASIATALGFFMVLLQFGYTRRKDKKDQKIAEEDRNRELTDAHEEQQRIKKQFDLQLAQSHTQQFENSLFSLLNLFNQIVMQLKYKSKTDVYGDAKIVEEHGREVFDEVARRIKRMCEIAIQNDPNDPENTFTHQAESVAEALYLMNEMYANAYYIDFEAILNHYFRTLYHIFKYIDESDLIKEERKNYYAGIVRSYLSQNELLAIMFNLVHEGYGYPNFLRFDKKYNVLKNFRHDAPFLKHFYDLYEAIKAGVDSKDGEHGISPKENRSLY